MKNYPDQKGTDGLCYQKSKELNKIRIIQTMLISILMHSSPVHAGDEESEGGRNTLSPLSELQEGNNAVPHIHGAFCNPDTFYPFSSFWELDRDGMGGVLKKDVDSRLQIQQLLPPGISDIWIYSGNDKQGDSYTGPIYPNITLEGVLTYTDKEHGGNRVKIYPEGRFRFNDKKMSDHSNHIYVNHPFLHPMWQKLMLLRMKPSQINEAARKLVENQTVINIGITREQIRKVAKLDADPSILKELYGDTLVIFTLMDSVQDNPIQEEPTSIVLHYTAVGLEKTKGNMNSLIEKPFITIVVLKHFVFVTHPLASICLGGKQIHVDDPENGVGIYYRGIGIEIACGKDGLKKLGILPDGSRINVMQGLGEYREIPPEQMKTIAEFLKHIQQIHGVLPIYTSASVVKNPDGAFHDDFAHVGLIDFFWLTSLSHMRNKDNTFTEEFKQLAARYIPNISKYNETESEGKYGLFEYKIRRILASQEKFRTLWKSSQLLKGEEVPLFDLINILPHHGLLSLEDLEMLKNHPLNDTSKANSSNIIQPCPESAY